MLTKKLKIQTSEITSETHLKKVTVSSKNKMGNDFIQNFGKNFFGRYSDYSSKGMRSILTSICLVESLDSEIIDLPLGYIEEKNSVVSLQKRGTKINTVDMDIVDFELLFCQIAEIIAVLHENRIVHGNISINSFKYHEKLKLSNYENCFMLLEEDFKILDYEPYREDFRPLESFNRECGFHTDIWALGCLFCVLLHGSNLFPFQINREEYISTLESWNDCSSKDIFQNVEIPKSWNLSENYKLNTIILKMLNPKKEKRPSIFEVINLLHKTDQVSSSPQCIASVFLNEIFTRTYKTCRYNDRSILGTPRNKILKRMEGNRQVKINLVMAIYENISCTPQFDEELFDLCLQIGNALIYEEFDLSIDKFKDILQRYNRGNEIFSISGFY